MNKIATTLYLIIIGITSCTKESAPLATSVLPADGVMRFATEVIDTKAGATTANLASFGINVDNATDAAFTYTNVEATKSGSTWTTAQAMNWQSESTPVTITAYAPYEATYTETFAVQTDQRTAAAVIASDFLYAQSAVSPNAPNAANPIHYNIGTEQVNIRLAHHMAKLTVKLTLSDHFHLATNPITAISINGCNTATAINLADGTRSTPTTIAAVTPYGENDYTNNGTFATVSYSAILPPQTAAAGTFSLALTIGGETHTWTATTDAPLAQATDLTLDLSVGRDNIALNGASVDAWTAGNTITGETTESTETTDPTDPPADPAPQIAVGHFRYTDGSTSATLDEAKTPQGIIFAFNATDATKGIILSLTEETNKTWSEATDEATAPWRLPTVEELRAIHTAKATLNAALTQVSGATPLGVTSTYWTSECTPNSLYATTVELEYGDEEGHSKTTPHTARTVTDY